jgi:tetratricopeptide (TPR) repeat protein
MRARVLVLGALLAGACQATPKPPAAPAAAAPQKRTTDGRLALENLDAGIVAAEKALRQDPSADARLTLATLLGSRAQIRASASDLERALALTEEAVTASPRDAKALLARAGARAALHRFADARADLDAAARLAQPVDDLGWSLDALRASLDEADGRLDDALPQRRRAAARWPSFDALAALAAATGDRGDTEAAHELFARALAAYRDVSPFAVAWLELQEGLMWERAGRYARARELYRVAHARLPDYVTVATHLAGVEAVTGDLAGAIAVLEPLVGVSEDPEVAGQLAALYQRGHRARAAGWLAELARTRYEALLARHPEAYADHAARFFLAAGADPGRAHLLAEANLARRHSADAWTLAIDAALAAGDAAAACRDADAALAGQRPVDAIVAAAARAYDGCGRADDARRVTSL